MTSDVEIPEPTVRTMRVAVSCVPGNFHFTLFVEYRGHRDGVDWYSVTDGFQTCPDTMDRKGRWCRELKPASHSPSWRKARQFTLAEAIEIARKYAPEMNIMGRYTVADALRERAESGD